jgi:hypothetical protein
MRGLIKRRRKESDDDGLDLFPEPRRENGLFRHAARVLSAADTRLRVQVVTTSGRATAVEFRVRFDAVEVWHWNHRCAVFDRWKLGQWLALPGAPMKVDQAALSVDRMVDRDGRVALSLPDVRAWTLAPAELADLRHRL